MPRVCPKCNRESPVDSDFCPACGAPMNEHALHGQTQAAVRALENPPMRWHKFLTWVSLPLSLILQFVALYNSVQTIRDFDPALYVPQYLYAVRLSMYLELGTGIMRLPLLAGAEYLLLKMKWTGVRLLLAVYLVEAAEAAVTLYLILSIHGDGLEAGAAAAGGAVITVLTYLYYKKRRKLFS